MDRETWETLLGRLREALVERNRDPGVYLRSDWEEEEIRIQDDRKDPPRWMTFDMSSDYEDQASFDMGSDHEDLAPRQLAPQMVEEALGPE